MKNSGTFDRTRIIFTYVVRPRRLELPRVSPLASETSASTIPPWPQYKSQASFRVFFFLDFYEVDLA